MYAMYALAAVENVLSATPLSIDARTRSIGTPPPMGMAARFDMERMKRAHETTMIAAPPNAKAREPYRSLQEPTGKRATSAQVAWIPMTAPTTCGPRPNSRTTSSPMEVFTSIRQDACASVARPTSTKPSVKMRSGLCAVRVREIN